MIWKAKELPHLNEVKVISKFAWLPVRIGNDYYWLGYYYQKYSYEETHFYTRSMLRMPIIKWVEKERALDIKNIPLSGLKYPA